MAAKSNNNQEQPLVFYSAWFCPYAQRVWMALNEHPNIQYQLVESLGSGLEASYTKHPDLLACNPKGLVPTLVVMPQQQKTNISRSGGNSHGANQKEQQILYDSLKILQELEEGNLGCAATCSNDNIIDNNKHRLQQQQLLKASSDEWNQRICSTFYRVLMTQTQAEQDTAWDELFSSLVDFGQHLSAEENGGYYDGDPNPGIVDWTVYPFVSRLFVLEHYRGYSLRQTVMAAVEQDSHNNTKTNITNLLVWQKRMEARPAVAATSAQPSRLLAIYERYANRSTQSQVGNAVKEGRGAHTV